MDHARMLPEQFHSEVELTSVSTHIIEYVTIASTGDTTDFGDLGTACDSGEMQWSISLQLVVYHAISRTSPGGPQN